MILLTMGTQPIKCNRIIDAVLNLKIKDDIIIQAYHEKNEYTNLQKNIKIFNFIPYSDMEEYIKNAEIIIVSGTGGILRALLMKKKLIIFPRLATYGEAIDNHGLDMKILADKGYAEFVDDAKDFKKIFLRCKKNTYKEFVSNNKTFIKELEKRINNL